MEDGTRNGGLPGRPIGRRGLMGALALAAAGAAAGCGGAQDSTEAPVVAKSLTMCIPRPASIDPALVSDEAGAEIASQLFEPLTAIDFTTGEVLGAAARRFDVSDDGLQVTFRLRESTFSNGDAVTSESFRLAWERVARPPRDAGAGEGTDAPNAYRLALVQGYDEFRSGAADRISGISCPDDETLVVSLSSPYAAFPMVAAHPSLAPVPAVAREDPDAFARKPVGNGPYALGDALSSSSTALHLTGSKTYRDGAPAVSAVHLVMQQDAVERYRRFLTGDADVSDCPIDEAAQAEARVGRSEDGMTISDGGRLVVGSDLSTSCLVLNLSAAPLDSVDVRRAIARAIDREEICDKIMRGAAAPADGVVAPGFLGYREGAWGDAVLDIAGARSLVDGYRGAAGTDGSAPSAPSGDTVEVSLVYASDSGQDMIMEAVAGDLEAVGISCAVEAVDADELEERLAAGTFSIARMDLVGDMPTQDAVLYPYFHSASIGARNFSGYRDAQFDALLDAARAQEDEDSREELYAQADAQLAHDVPVVPLVFGSRLTVGSDRIERLAVDPCGSVRFASAELAG